uniref:Uncharacterized protein n=1 Tax=Magallana gigas TaxID=29159 RepID=K1R430_MAGGI
MADLEHNYRGLPIAENVYSLEMHDRNHRLSEITERRFGEDKISQHVKGSVILAFHPSAGEFSTSEEFFEATRLYRHEDTDIDGLRVMERAVYEDVPTNPQEKGCSHLFCYYCVQVTTNNQYNTWQYFKYFGIMNIHDDSIVMDFMGNFLQPIFIRTG